MAEATVYKFTHKEIAEALVKQLDIHEGIWGVYIEFGIAAANIAMPQIPDILPTALVPVKTIGIHRFDEHNNLTIDAADVNPAPKTGATSSRRKKVR